MSPPPEWLTGWTQYFVLVIGGVTAIRALVEGGTLLNRIKKSKPG
jgi:hypothetical protein